MIGEVVLGRFEVFRLLHEVGLSKVYLALETATQRLVMIQVLQAKLRQQPRFEEIFKREMELLNHFQHRHATAVIESSYENPQGPCIVLEKAEGTPLDEMMQSHERFSAMQVGKWLGQICAALQHAYLLGILHRDLSPSNIIVANVGFEFESIKVKNFGLSQLTVAPHLTLEAFRGQAKELLATPAYMCPEQALGEEMDQRGDIYSLGVILFELLTGVHPFQCTTREEFIEAHAHTLPPSFADVGVTDLHPDVEKLVQQCLMKYNAWRPFDAKEVVRTYGRALCESFELEVEDAPEMPLSESGIFKAPPPGAVIYRLEGWMPESIAVIKTQGFVEGLKGEVVESIPGLVRVKFPRPSAPAPPPPKSKSGLFRLFSELSQMSQTKPATPPPPKHFINLDLHMEKKDPAQPNLLTITLVLHSEKDKLADNSEAVKYCDMICKGICSYLMAKRVDEKNPR